MNKEDLHRLVDALSDRQAHLAKRLLEALIEEAENDIKPLATGAQHTEDEAWLAADLGGPLPPYDWGPEGPPTGKPVQYIPGKGVVIMEGGEQANDQAAGRR